MEAVEGVPARVAAAAKAQGLHDFHGGYRRPDNVMYVIFWAVLVFFLVQLTWSYLVDPQLGVLGTGSASSRNITRLIGLALALCLAYSVRRVVGSWRLRKFYLYAEGLVSTSGSGRVRRACTWDGVRVYFSGNGRSGSTLRSYRYVFSKGGTYRFGVLAHSSQNRPPRDGVWLRSRALNLAAKLPEALENFHAGHIAVFGPCIVDIEGVTYRARTLPWSKVVSVAVLSDTYLHFRSSVKGKGMRVQMSRIPDSDVLLKLVEAAGIPIVRVWLY